MTTADTLIENALWRIENLLDRCDLIASVVERRTGGVASCLN